MPDLTSGASRPATSTGATQAFPPLRYNDYCSAQMAIAEANSRRDTLRTGKRVVYKAPCELEAPPAAKPADKPKAPKLEEPGTA